MNSLVEAKVKNYLRDVMRFSPNEAGTIVGVMRDLAKIVGHDLDERFATTGLGAGPEASVAACIVDRALFGAGHAASNYDLRAYCDKWLRETPLSVA